MHRVPISDEIRKASSYAFYWSNFSYRSHLQTFDFPGASTGCWEIFRWLFSFGYATIIFSRKNITYCIKLYITVILLNFDNRFLYLIKLNFALILPLPFLCWFTNRRKKNLLFPFYIFFARKVQYSCKGTLIVYKSGLKKDKRPCIVIAVVRSVLSFIS